ncbi:MAG TPA: hypothetical protein DCS07_11880 [Bdellovibrionales bacterium]|nr:hypothetical protein [Bdellovibrionales bacterium]
MSNVTLNSVLSALPADISLDGTEKMTTSQSGTSRSIPLSDIRDFVLSLLTPEIVDTSAGSVVKTLPTTAIFKSHIKGTDDENVVTFNTSDGSTIAEVGIELSTQHSRVDWNKVGTVWYRK